MPAPSRKLTVYVVDDDPAVLGSLGFLLETEGFSVRTFSSGGAFLRALKPAQADCFVIDYKMAEMDGLDVASRLRDQRIGVPIILITGYPDASITAKAAAVGVQEVLLKPHLEETLVAHIRNATRETSHSSGMIPEI